MTATTEQTSAQPIKVVQITNIAPQATKDQMQTLFGFLGKIEDIRLYPTIRDVSVPVQSRICFVKFFDSSCVGVAQHMTNTVFIDRALIVTPFQSTNNDIPDEFKAREIAQQANIVPGLYGGNSKLPPHVTNQIEGNIPNQVITTHDPMLVSNGLPPYPPLPITFDSIKIEEIRRTLLASNIAESVTAQQLIDFFCQAGDVKYIRFCEKEDLKTKYALIEFSEQSSVIQALKMNSLIIPNTNTTLTITHSVECIEKPQAKSNEAAQREIEEAMTRVKEAQNLISAAIDPVIGILSKEKKRGRSRSRSRRRSRSRSRGSKRHRSRSRSRRHRSRSRKRSRSRSRRHSRSRERRHRSSSRTRKRKSKSQSRDRKRRRSRTRSRSRKRDRSRERSKRKDDKDRLEESFKKKDEHILKEEDANSDTRDTSPKNSDSDYTSKRATKSSISPEKKKRSRSTSGRSSRSPSRSKRGKSRSPSRRAKSKSRSSRSPVTRRRSQSRTPRRGKSRSRSRRKSSRSPRNRRSRSRSRRRSRSRKRSRTPRRKRSSPSPPLRRYRSRSRSRKSYSP